MLKIEIFQEDVSIETRTTKPKDDKPGRKIYEQSAYVYLGDKFPVKMKLSLDEEQKPFDAGLYTLCESSFFVNTFGGLELKKFGVKVTPLKDSA